MILLLFIYPSYSQIDFAYVFTDNPISSVSSTYTVEIYQNTILTIDANTIIEINFPSQYTNVAENRVYNCYTIYWPTNLLTPTPLCDMIGLKIIVSNIFPVTYIPTAT